MPHSLVRHLLWHTPPSLEMSEQGHNLLKVRNATTKNSSAALENTSFQESPSCNAHTGGSQRRLEWWWVDPRAACKLAGGHQARGKSGREGLGPAPGSVDSVRPPRLPLAASWLAALGPTRFPGQRTLSLTMHDTRKATCLQGVGRQTSILPTHPPTHPPTCLPACLPTYHIPGSR